MWSHSTLGTGSPCVGSTCVIEQELHTLVRMPCCLFGIILTCESSCNAVFGQIMSNLLGWAFHVVLPEPTFEPNLSRDSWVLRGGCKRHNLDTSHCQLCIIFFEDSVKWALIAKADTPRSSEHRYWDFTDLSSCPFHFDQHSTVSFTDFANFCSVLHCQS